MCRKKMPYILSVQAMMEISEAAFVQHTTPIPPIGRLWFDNGESISLNSDAQGSYTDASGKEAKKDIFFGASYQYRQFSKPKDADPEKISLEDSFNTRENQHKLALLFQKHLPIAISYGDYAVSISYVDLAPVKEFQKYLNDQQLLKETAEYADRPTKAGEC
ncbi:hypothetical protein FAI40_04705 [Acetobacteraceae bacterium]|nr:hypothetical protein FAI40_04705 [Acetobacteraceae bacterium]